MKAKCCSLEAKSDYSHSSILKAHVISCEFFVVNYSPLLQTQLFDVNFFFFFLQKRGDKEIDGDIECKID